MSDRVVSDDQAVQATNDDAASCKRYYPIVIRELILQILIGMQSRRGIGKILMLVCSQSHLNASLLK